MRMSESVVDAQFSGTSSGYVTPGLVVETGVVQGQVRFAWFTRAH